MDGELIGKVSAVNAATGEILVQAGEAGEKIRMGMKLYVRLNGEPAVMTATFPMQATAKCRLLPEHAMKLRGIARDMKVYSYVKGVEAPAAPIVSKRGLDLGGLWMIKGDTSCNRIVFEISGEDITAYHNCPAAGPGHPSYVKWVLFKGKLKGRNFTARYNPYPNRENYSSVQVGDVQGKISGDGKTVEVWGLLYLWTGMVPAAYNGFKARIPDPESVRYQYVRTPN